MRALVILGIVVGLCGAPTTAQTLDDCASFLQGHQYQLAAEACGNVVDNYFALQSRRGDEPGPPSDSDFIEAAESAYTASLASEGASEAYAHLGDLQIAAVYLRRGMILALNVSVSNIASPIVQHIAKLAKQLHQRESHELAALDRRLAMIPVRRQPRRPKPTNTARTPATLRPLASPSPTPTPNPEVEIVRQYIEALQRHDPSAAAQYLSAGAPDEGFIDEQEHVTSLTAARNGDGSMKVFVDFNGANGEYVETFIVVAQRIADKTFVKP